MIDEEKLTEWRAICDAANAEYVAHARTTLEAIAEIRRLQESIASVCADAEIVGYYGEDLDSAAQCFLERIEEQDRKIAEYDQIFALQQSRMGEATKLWQEATGKHDILPDLGDLLGFLMSRARPTVPAGELNPRDPRIDPQPGDVVDMQPSAKGKWTRHVDSVADGKVYFRSRFHGVYLDPMVGTIEEWRDSVKERK
jgi:hypothetical protein